MQKEHKDRLRRNWVRQDLDRVWTRSRLSQHKIRTMSEKGLKTVHGLYHAESEDCTVAVHTVYTVH